MECGGGGRGMEECGAPRVGSEAVGHFCLSM